MSIDSNPPEDFFFFASAAFRRPVSASTRSNPKSTCPSAAMPSSAFASASDAPRGALAFGFLPLLVVSAPRASSRGGFERAGGAPVAAARAPIARERRAVSDDERDCASARPKTRAGSREKDARRRGRGRARLVVARELTRGWLPSFATANASGDGAFL